MSIVPPVNAAQAVADTRRWLERAVIGLNLCPFAKSVHTRGQVHFAPYLTDQPTSLLEALSLEAKALAACAPSVRDTTLLIAPHMSPAFIAFHEFTRRAERWLSRAGYDGILQLASFHPEFQFAGNPPEDIENATNWAPYPTLHLLREDSVSRAVAVFPEAKKIFERNIRTMQGLGREGWEALAVGPGAAQV